MKLKLTAKLERLLGIKADQHDAAVGAVAEQLAAEAKPMPSDPEEFTKEFHRRTAAGQVVPTIRSEAGELFFVTDDDMPSMRIES